MTAIGNPVTVMVHIDRFKRGLDDKQNDLVRHLQGYIVALPQGLMEQNLAHVRIYQNTI